MSDSLRTYGLQHPKLLCPPLSPRVCSSSCLLCWWCYLTVSSSAASFTLPQSFPASGPFPMSGLFTSGGQSIVASASALILPVNIQDCFSLGLTDLISFQSKVLSRVFFSTTIQKHQFLVLSLLYGPTLTFLQDYWKKHSFGYMNLCWQNVVSVF